MALGAETAGGDREEQQRLDPSADAAEPAAAGDAGNTDQSYCIIFEGLEDGENTIDVIQVPYRGNETVLDALANLRGLSDLSKKSIWIARFASDGSGQEEIVPVDWNGLARANSEAVNPRILANDRIFVVQTKKKLDLKSLLDKPGYWLNGKWRALRGFRPLGRSVHKIRR